MSGDAPFSLADLFRQEAESQTEVLGAGLLALERDPRAGDQLETCMRAAHSLKGAARVVGLDMAVRVAHELESCFVAAQRGSVVLQPPDITALLTGTDLLTRIAGASEDELGEWLQRNQADVDDCLAALAGIAAGRRAAAAPVPARREREPWTGRDNSDRVLRVSTDNLNRLLSLAGESLVESKWLKPFGSSLLRLKRTQHELSNALEDLRGPIASAGKLTETIEAALVRAQELASDCQRALADRLAELETFDRRSSGLSVRLHDEALACRMRPFADGVQAFPRMVRDLGQSLGKPARLDVLGDTTQVDRDILTSLDAPLGHLLRNAVDHGIEPPDARLAAGKPAEAVIRLEARHCAGLLQIIVADDGPGVDLDRIRARVIERGLITPAAAAGLSRAELLEFLFLPGFSTRTEVTEISGRGVGLDVVHDMVKRVRGTVRASTEAGKGTEFHLLLPVTLSVVRTLMAEIGGEPYAFPLVNILRTVRIPGTAIQSLEGRRHFDFEGRPVGLIRGTDAFGLPAIAADSSELSVIVLGDERQPYGFVVDRFLGERELAVRPIDAQLGKVKDIASAAMMDDGAPVLIVDVEDLLQTMGKLSAAGPGGAIVSGPVVARSGRTKRVLVVDDSLTVRELERKLLASRGYAVDVAVDGMDGWNSVRAGQFDLVVTDVDMPRMDGIDLVRNITSDTRLAHVPVMIVSYKDRAEERQRGLEAGAAYYLTKGSFHDDSFLQAVTDLIGEAGA